MVITVAPAQRANWMAALPTAPAPPCTKTIRPSNAPGQPVDLTAGERSMGGHRGHPE
ncbi:hypothetical protein GCM10027613_20540 [Microlunatus endophyticus]